MSDELIELLFAEAEEKMEKSVSRTKSEFSSIRTGRPSPALVERIQVDYFGSDVPLQQLASFSVPEAQLLVIAPFDKGAIEAIERAIVLADLGVSPANDGSILRLNFPPLTEERLKQLVKVVKNLAEEGRISILGIRRSVRQELDNLDKSGDVSSDEAKRASEKIDVLTRDFEGQINAALEQKETELLEV